MMHAWEHGNGAIPLGLWCPQGHPLSQMVACRWLRVQVPLGHLCHHPLPPLPAAAFPVTTPEPLVLVTPPRCLTANRTQQGVLLSWLPPANHSFPIDRYIMEFRVGEHWEMLDDAIPGTDGEFFAKDLSQVRYLAFPCLFL